jgi:hypothetical protein
LHAAVQQNALPMQGVFVCAVVCADLVQLSRGCANFVADA